jgi:hypothetical protein
VTVSGATDNFGQTMTAYTYTFTTSKAFNSGGQCPCTVWPDTAPSGATDTSDTSSVELGLKFTASSNGTISGVRFYKEPDNTGTHTGTLWSSSGTVLATGTFTSESTQGWQELDFSTPVTVTAGTTYVASYHTNTGEYSADGNYFAAAHTDINGTLTAPSSSSSGGNGVYAYGSSSLFPNNSYNATNYWVDVVFNGQLVG